MARVDRRTRQLVKRLRPGDIAIIDHVDIDRLAAESLVECGVAAVVNAATSISGRYPNLGPEILVANGIPLLDGVGTACSRMFATATSSGSTKDPCMQAIGWSQRESSRRSRACSRRWPRHAPA